jgi:hypothetical protein
VIGLAVNRLLGAQAAVGWASTCLAAEFFCLAGSAYVMGRMMWYVPQARRRLRKYGPDSKAFKKSMRRSLPGNGSLIFQTAVAIFVLVVSV